MPSHECAIAASGDFAGCSEAHTNRQVENQTDDESRRKLHGPFQGSGHFS